MDQELQQRLLKMAADDQRVRAELAATGELFRGYAPRMAELHRRNAEVLDSIINTHGWPGRSLVGDDGAKAAWLVLQHAIGNPELQRKCLPILQAAAASGDADTWSAVYLEDRICFFERRPQRYGTQFDWDDDGELSPWVLEDPARVDEYRRSVGLSSIAQRIAQVRSQTEEPRPADLKQRLEEMEAWAKSVGWR